MFMGDKAKLAALAALICPLVVYRLLRIGDRRTLQFAKLISLGLYCAVILYLTLFDRSAGTERIANLRLFWSYELFHDPQYRWQIYMNVFLFIPFGFFVPWATGKNLLNTVLFGVLLSGAIELCQYMFKLGLSEIDDVLHNALGTALGYGYWKAVCTLEARAARFESTD